ncbi:MULTISPECIES: hypothetical protein [unclassified Bilifractor]|uniref:hypothetical protein n=1 Tax=unclassified Bilifractor TaxID=2815795 RepID=UPI003F8FFE79
MSPEAGAAQLGIDVASGIQEINQAVMSRAYKVQNALRNAEIEVLTSGSYPPASAPGEVPHMRSGNLRNLWTFGVRGGSGNITVFGEPGVNYAGYLEEGTRKMAARPFVDKIIERTEKDIDGIFADL